eukprot:3699073-Rhodomonas_salina.3
MQMVQSSGIVVMFGLGETRATSRLSPPLPAFLHLCPSHFHAAPPLSGTSLHVESEEQDAEGRCMCGGGCGRPAGVECARHGAREQPALCGAQRGRCSV